MPLETIHVPVVAHSVLYRELCRSHVVEKPTNNQPEKANFISYRVDFTEMFFPKWGN